MPNFGLMSGNPYYSGPSAMAGGVNAFADNLMKAYGMFSGVRQKDDELAMQRKIMQLKLDEADRQQQAGDAISAMLQPQKQNYFEQQGVPVIGPENYNEGMTNSNQMTPLGKQKLQGLLGGVAPTMAQTMPVIGPENMGDPGTQQVANPAFAPAQQAALAQMQQQGGEMVQPKMDMQKLIGVLAKGNPIEAAKLQVSMQNTEAKAEMQKYVNDAKYEYIKELYASKTAQEKELAKMKYENSVQLLEEKYNNLKDLKKMPSISIHTGGGKEDDGSKDQIKLNRAQNMAKRDLGVKYTFDSMTGTYLDKNNSPVPREKINKEYQALVQQYHGSKGKSNTDQADPVGIL